MKICVVTQLDRILCFDEDRDQLVIYRIIDVNDERYLIDEYCDYFENYGTPYWVNCPTEDLTDLDLPYYFETKSNCEVTSEYYNEAFEYIKRQTGKDLWIDY